LHSQDDGGTFREADTSHEGKLERKKSIVPQCYPKNTGSKVPPGGAEHQQKQHLGKAMRGAAPHEENGSKAILQETYYTRAINIEGDRVRRSQRRGSVMQPRMLRKQHAAGKEEENIINNKENIQNNDVIGQMRPKLKGTFYGKAQPPSALVPLPPRQSYSDQSDCDSLIDDAEVEQDDLAWVEELRDTLGGYIEKDFSEIDRLPDRRMQASFDQMMEEEANTSRIGLAIDRREAARESALAKKRRRRKRRLATAMVISECDDDDA